LKLKYNQVKPHRELLLEQQDYKCALCGDSINGDAVLDHDHKTGKIRRVLHRGCNCLLGKIENNLPRNKVTLGQLAVICQNLVKYLEEEYEDVVHPTYRTQEERKMMKKKGRGKGRGRGR